MKTLVVEGYILQLPTCFFKMKAEGRDVVWLRNNHDSQKGSSFLGACIMAVSREHDNGEL
jgi:hypothetical protein